jgi:endonuclease IV
MSHRVLTLIPFLNYGQLSKILPKEKMFTAKTVPTLGGTVILPALLKKLGPSDYGLLVEEIIAAMLNDDDLSQIKNITNVEAWTPLKEFVDQHLYHIPLEYQVTLNYEKIVGHPDLMSFDTTYDVKTTGRFGRMRINTILQLLSYYTLAKLNNLPITSIGLILPLQSLVVTYDLKDWDYKPFYNELVKAIDLKLTKELTCYNLSLNHQIIFLQLYNQFVGHHCHKNQLQLSDKPQQFFLSGNQTSKISFTKKFKLDLTTINKQSVSPVYIHSPYLINLSFPGKKQREGDEDINKKLGNLSYGSWTFYCLKQLLEFGQETNINGVVVHVGKCCGEDYTFAVNNFKQSVIDCSQFASPTCKLIIETPAGQSGEILTSAKEFSDFYESLPNEVKNNVGVCVDLCHVFAAGENPMTYLTTLLKRNIQIDLIHFNDSKGECGCKKDRHAGVGKGYIGWQTLHDVLNHCIKYNIPMLTE